ncbi:unnamed protein product [Enterobius vermicularis]|uniref:WD_REPEATS_REGION domain-containing protein n=1 Tax=Enterobius vermicularis TaxID=51028 RepID=A0A0N4VRA0_ENTVE|nr:unnamed protein product [Enterobius vermicularis]
MGSADDIRLVSGIDDRIPRLYEVQKGQKTQSYISAITGTPLISESVPPLCQPDKNTLVVVVVVVSLNLCYH